MKLFIPLHFFQEFHHEAFRLGANFISKLYSEVADFGHAFECAFEICTGKLGFLSTNLAAVLDHIVVEDEWQFRRL